MNQPLQSMTMANLLAASRLPQEGDFRRNAILGAMVGQMNPMAGALVAVRSADAVTDLMRERDSLKAAQTRPPGGEPGAPGGTPAPAADPAETARLARQLIQAALHALEALTSFVEEAKRAESGSGATAQEASETGWGGAAAATETGNPSAATGASMPPEVVAAVTAIARAIEKMAAEAEKAVRNQDENQTALQQVMERLGTGSAASSASGSAASGSGTTGPGKGSK